MGNIVDERASVVISWARPASPLTPTTMPSAIWVWDKNESFRHHRLEIINHGNHRVKTPGGRPEEHLEKIYPPTTIRQHSNWYTCLASPINYEITGREPPVIRTPPRCCNTDASCENSWERPKPVLETRVWFDSRVGVDHPGTLYFDRLPPQDKPPHGVCDAQVAWSTGIPSWAKLCATCYDRPFFGPRSKTTNKAVRYYRSFRVSGVCGSAPLTPLLTKSYKCKAGSTFSIGKCSLYAFRPPFDIFWTSAIERVVTPPKQTFSTLVEAMLDPWRGLQHKKHSACIYLFPQNRSCCT